MEVSKTNRTGNAIVKKKKGSCFMRVLGSLIGMSPEGGAEAEAESVSKPHSKDTRDDYETSARSTHTFVKEKRLLEELNRLNEHMASLPSDKMKNQGTTKLHIACEQHYSDELIIEVLMKSDSKAVFMENASKELPLHSAMRVVHHVQQHYSHGELENSTVGVSKRVLQKLLSLNQDAVKHVNSNNCLPIHIACQFAHNEFVIKTLLDIYPQSVMTQCQVTLPFDDRSTEEGTIDVSFSDDELFNHLNSSNSDSEDDDSQRQSLFIKFWNIFLNPVGLSLSPPSPQDNDKSNTTDSGACSDVETDYSPLHLAILNNASPSVIDHILNANPYCLNLKTSRGRTAMDIAKRMDNAQDFIEIMKSYQRNVKHILHLDAFSKSLINLSPEDIEKKKSLQAKKMWKKAGNAVIFANRLKLSLGPKVDIDNDDSMKVSDNFELPPCLERKCVDIILPVGFHQLRWALLNNESSFYKDFHETSMGYSEFDMSSWDKFDNEIGQTQTKSAISSTDDKKFINATRNVNFLMPKTMLVAANMCYTSETIIEYSDECIAIMRVAKNPDVPMGTTFEAHCLDVFVNTGSNTSRMISSGEAKFYGKPPFIAWKIRTAMHDGITMKSVALGEAICEIKADDIYST